MKSYVAFVALSVAGSLRHVVSGAAGCLVVPFDSGGGGCYVDPLEALMDAGIKIRAVVI